MREYQVSAWETARENDLGHEPVRVELHHDHVVFANECLEGVLSQICDGGCDGDGKGKQSESEGENHLDMQQQDFEGCVSNW